MLKIENLSKKFGDIEVLKSLEFEIKEGEIHGLVGANGSGKSTLLNILFGNSIIRKTGGFVGKIMLDNKELNLKSPHDAIKNGIGMIHQEYALINSMTVGENIKINRENVVPLTKKLFGNDFSYVNKQRDREDAQDTLKKLRMKINEQTMVFDLSINMKQFVEIAREINKEDLKLLLLDEPTAVLSKEDSKLLIDILKQIASKGTMVIFVSHRIEEVIELCDKITILRDGEIVNRFDKKDFEVELIAQNMIGYKVVKTQREDLKQKSEIIMSFKDFSVNIPSDEAKSINLDIYKGEILGITGLSGHGKSALSYGIIGMYKTKGEVVYNGCALNVNDTKNTIDKGIYVIPEDRRGMGLLLDDSVTKNIIFAALQNKNEFLKKFPINSLRILDKKKANKYVRNIIQDFKIKCTSENQKVNQLSGGNQQKVCIARAVSINPKVLFVSEPTRGVDIAAKEVLLDMLIKINEEEKTTVIVASSEIEELKRICDRIVVMYEGRIFDILKPDSSDKKFALALSGERRG